MNCGGNFNNKGCNMKKKGKLNYSIVLLILLKLKEFFEKIVFSEFLIVVELVKKLYRELFELIKKLFMFGVVVMIN